MLPREEWFAAVARHDPWFNRKDDNTLVLTFSGYKCGNYFDAEEELRQLGAMFLTADFDQVSGRTFCHVREPRKLAPVE